MARSMARMDWRTIRLSLTSPSRRRTTILDLLQRTLGKDFNIIILAFGMTLCYALLRKLQRWSEDLVFVQLLLSFGPDEEQEKLDDYEDDMQYGGSESQDGIALMRKRRNKRNWPRRSGPTPLTKV